MLDSRSSKLTSHSESLLTESVVGVNDDECGCLLQNHVIDETRPKRKEEGNKDYIVILAQEAVRTGREL